MATINAQSNSYFSVKETGELYEIIQLSTGEYITYGTQEATGLRTLQLVKWDANFNELWNYEFPNSEVQASQGLVKVVESRMGSIYLCVPTAGFGESVVFKISSAGAMIWQKEYDISGSLPISSFQKAVPGDDGFVFGTGACSVSNGVIKCDADGNIEWQKRFGRTDATGVVTCTGIVNDGSEYIVTSSFSVNSIVNQRLDSDGNLLNYVAYTHPNLQMKPNISRSFQGGLAITGNYNSNNGGANKFICFVNSDLTISQYKHLGLSNGSYLNFGGFAVDGSGQNVLMSGSNLPGNGSGNTSASYVLSLSSAGALNWGYNSTERNYFYGITSFDNTIVNVGMGRSIFVGVPDFPVVNIIDTDGAGLCDSTILPLVITDFTLDNATGTTTENSTSAFTATTSSVSYINTAQFTRAMICGSEPSVGLDAQEDLTSWSIYPNPANESISVAFSSEEPVALSIVDLSGKEVLTVSDYSTDSALDVSHLTSGFYMIHMRRDGHKMTSRKLIKN